MAEHRKTLSHYKACLLAGAIGDALGAPIEFMNWTAIQEKYGEKGITGYVELDQQNGAFTDDTQMSLFTAEGLLNAKREGHHEGLAVYESYLRWLYTQGDKVTPFKEAGWLLTQKGLHQRRSPGNTCLSALRSGQMGILGKPINDSKGCGGIMRVAPVSLLFADEPEEAFHIACEVAAITHGHPSAYLSAGYLAAFLSYVLQGEDLRHSIMESIKLLRRWEQHEEVLSAIEGAIELFERTPQISPESIEQLGGAWVGEEALAISLYCTLYFENDLPAGLLAAVNHSGDGDSTGAIVGNMLGAINGMGVIPQEWIDKLMLADLVDEVAIELYQAYAKEDKA